MTTWVRFLTLSWSSMRKISQAFDLFLRFTVLHVLVIFLHGSTSSSMLLYLELCYFYSNRVGFSVLTDEVYWDWSVVEWKKINVDTSYFIMDSTVLKLSQCLKHDNEDNLKNQYLISTTCTPNTEFYQLTICVCSHERNVPKHTNRRLRGGIS